MLTKSSIHVSAGAAVMLALLLLVFNERVLIALFPALLVHEGGHCLALSLCRARVTELRLDLGGLCLVSTALTSRGEEVCCALAGPAAGLLWAGAAAAHWPLSAGLSLTLSVYNLLPALPLDGGRALLALCGCRGLLRISGAASAATLGALAIWAPLPLALPTALWLWVESFRA